MNSLLPADHDLQERYVRLALQASRHRPLLLSAYCGPRDWLVEAHGAELDPTVVRRSAQVLEVEAQRRGSEYLAVQSAAIAVHLDPDALHLAYPELVSRLYGVAFETPDRQEVDALRESVEELARSVVGKSSGSAALTWESLHALTGEAKWDAAIDAYRRGREYVRTSFPLAIREDDLEIARMDDPLKSVHIVWREPDRLAFEVNTAVPRTSATTAFEVAHNIYPGDYLHMAALRQHAYLRRGNVAASIKLKNAPENLLAEGLEDLAQLLMELHPSPEVLLASQLEWLRRAATLEAALLLRVELKSEVEVLRHLESAGLMTRTRAAQQLGLVKHSLWGNYQYCYWWGRRQVAIALERARKASREASFLVYLYGDLIAPIAFARTAAELTATPLG